MYDVIETIGSSKVQHGKSSDRVYLMKLQRDSHPNIIPQLYDRATQNHYGKIFAKIPAWAVPEFAAAGYMREGRIPGFYNGNTDAVFMAYFTDPDRAFVDESTKEKIAGNISLALEKAASPQQRTLPDDYTLRKLGRADAQAVTEVYRAVFASYPFPIYEPAYIIETMESGGIEYFGVFNKGQLVAASSSELDLEGQNVEMTDFATLPAHLGNGLAAHLLKKMEAEMQARGIRTFYTIARAMSAGMNITFAKNNYRFGGTLMQNTNISGSIECMNVWYKQGQP